ncbi:phage tail tape measure protein [Bordetella petrii]|uniref:Bacteriophage protein n=1 Tax=Bordetella petrii (strain ATCC BAA-461 / DSM 12804 / CCUG 43448 / CIP 107267 / Se-1111R) TaxID=340100 RepID=A9IRX8_BORPD|nr:phage tail tape measure protein [Bordetella petrii]CAP43230.1 putative bacteriophage protein [Bordetella petrii]
MNKRLSATITIGGAVAGSFKRTVTSAKTSITSLGSTVKRLNAEQRTLGGAIQKLGRSGANIDGLRSRYAAVTAELEKQRAVLGRLQRIEERRDAALAKRQVLVGQLTRVLAVGAAYSAAVFKVGRDAAAHQKELVTIQNTGGLTDAETRDLDRQIFETSRKTGQSVESVTSGVGSLVASGLAVGEAIATAETLGKAVTATGGTMEDMAQTAFSLNQQLGITAKQAGVAFDILNTAGKAGNFELAEMAKHAPKVGSLFKALGMQGLDAAASMGAAFQIVRTGAGSSDEAATNLSNLLGKMVAPETLKRFQKLYGVDMFGEIQEAQKRGEDVLQFFVDRTRQLTGGRADLVAELVPDVQAGSALRALMTEREQYQRIKRDALNSAGSVDADFSKMMGTAATQAENLSNSVGRLSKTIGQTLLPAIGNVAGGLVTVIDRVTAWTAANPRLTQGIVAVGGAVIGLGAAFTALRIAATFLSPVGAIIGALAGAAVLVYKNWEPIKAFFTDTWNSVKATTIGVWDGLKGYFTSLWDSIKLTASGALDWLIDKISAVGSAWTKTKEFFGVGDENPNASVMDGYTPPAPPQAPPMATARGGASGTWQDNRSITLNVNPAPGMDENKLAELVVDKINHRDAVRRRSFMFDGVTQ